MNSSQFSSPLVGFIFPLPGLSVGYVVPVYVADGTKKIQSIDPLRLTVAQLTGFSDDESFVSMVELEKRSSLVIKDKYLNPPSENEPAVFAMFIYSQLVMGTVFELSTWCTDNRIWLENKLREFPNFRKDLLEFLKLSVQIAGPTTAYKSFTDRARAPYKVRSLRKSCELAYE
jgi:hypothetical protein